MWMAVFAITGGADLCVLNSMAAHAKIKSIKNPGFVLESRVFVIFVEQTHRRSGGGALVFIHR